MRRIERPVAFAAAIVGSLLIGIVAVFELIDAFQITKFRGAPDPLGLGIGIVMIAYLVSVWALMSGRFGKWVVPLHTALAVPVATAAIGVLTTAAAIMVAVGLFGAEAYCSSRRAVAGLRA